jgi:hypothetical protein
LTNYVTILVNVGFGEYNGADPPHQNIYNPIFFPLNTTDENEALSLCRDWYERHFDL